MAKKVNGVNKSEKIREILKAHPEMRTNDIVSTLARQGANVTSTLVHFVKGKLKGRQARKTQVRSDVAKVAETTNHADTVSIILKVKKLASEVGGLGKLKALVEALS